MPVIVTREYDGNRADLRISALVGIANADGDTPSVVAVRDNLYNVFPVVSGGFLENDTYITNMAATYEITGQNDGGGTFYFDHGGAFALIGATADASFSYRVNDYDGDGNFRVQYVSITYAG